MKDIKEYIIEQQNQKIIGIKSTTIDDIKNYVHDIIKDIIEENDLDVQIIDLYVHGSRVFGKPHKDSDLDVVLYYKGNMTEDSLFNILHDDEYKDNLTYDGIDIDINPIRDKETGSLEKYIEKDKNYHK